MPKNSNNHIFLVKEGDIGEFYSLRESIKRSVSKNKKLSKQFESFLNLLEHQNLKNDEAERLNERQKINVIISKTVSRFNGIFNPKEDYSFECKKQKIVNGKKIWFTTNLNLIISHVVHTIYYKSNSTTIPKTKKALIEHTYRLLFQYVKSNLPKRVIAKIKSHYVLGVLTGFIVSEIIKSNPNYEKEYNIDNTLSAQKIYNHVAYRINSKQFNRK